MKLDVYKCFLPECNLDSTLVEVLLNKPFAVNHNKGNSNVAVKMTQAKMKDSFAVGIIDEDKVKLKALEDFKIIERLARKNVKLYSHRKRKHYFIQLCPAVEAWILNECNKADIQLINYELPTTLRGLIKMKGLKQRNDNRFVRLFKEMEKNIKCDEVNELKRWLRFLRDNHINTNFDLL